VVTPVPEAPRLGLALVYGAGAGIATAVVFAVVGGAADLSLALPFVAGAGGLLIGLATRRGAWSGPARRPSRWVPVLAVSVALAAWLAGEFGAYLLTRLLLPDSALSFVDRLGSVSFGDWMSPQFGPLEIIELFLLGGFAWYASR